MLIDTFRARLGEPVGRGPQKIAVAFSGGGDSTALLALLCGACRGKNIHALIVDHGFRANSGTEAKLASERAAQIGAHPTILTWRGKKPRTGIQAKARQMRYALLGETCRKLGITKLYLGHTKDDQAETLLMRYDRKTGWRGAAGMASRTYAPLWPELMGVTVIRPLLGFAREQLRVYLRQKHIPWIDDPGNENREFTRVRARNTLHFDPELKNDLLEAAHELCSGRAHEQALFEFFCQQHVSCTDQGLILADQIPPPPLLKQLLRIASGTGGPIDQKAVNAFARSMGSPKFSGATLAGAQVLSGKDGYWIGRDPVAAKGRYGKPALAIETLEPQTQLLWDGRFLVRCQGNGLTIRPLFENMSRLSKIQRKSLKSVRPGFRETLPLVIGGNGEVFSCPGVVLHPDVDIECVLACRLQQSFETRW